MNNLDYHLYTLVKCLEGIVDEMDSLNTTLAEANETLDRIVDQAENIDIALNNIEERIDNAKER